jgi:hypothetical protein
LCPNCAQIVPMPMFHELRSLGIEDKEVAFF